MNYSKNVNKMPYEKYGRMLFSGELVVIRVNYDYGYVIVSDKAGQLWQVTCDMTFGVTSALVVLTKVVE